jgi:hypothetical protein
VEKQGMHTAFGGKRLLAKYQLMKKAKKEVEG